MTRCPWCNQTIDSRLKRCVRACVIIPIALAIIFMVGFMGLYAFDYAVEKRCQYKIKETYEIKKK